MTLALALEILGFVVGIAYLWWEYHADAKVWIASIIMPAISMWIYFSKGIYADFAINIYYLFIAVYGYIAWKKGIGKKSKPITITHTPLRAWVVIVAATLAIWTILSYILEEHTDSTVPYIDAFTTALSIVAMWMMARKYAEQWLAWLIVDIVSTGLYIYKGLVFYPVLYGAYSVIAIFGYRKWLHLMKDENNC